MKSLNIDETHTEENAADASYEFDWKGLATSLGEQDSDEDQHNRLKELSQALGVVIDWLANVDLDKPNAERLIARRVIAFIWVTDPKRFESLSLRRIAAKLKLYPREISPITAEFSRVFGIRNKMQDHDWRN